MKKLIDYISEKTNTEIIHFHPISGGDISAAYLIESEKRKFFLKVNSKSFAKEMFLAEQKGLQTIENTKTIAVPHVHLVDQSGGKSFLLIDFIENRRPNTKDYKHFGRDLAKLHSVTTEKFGFSSDNFIGSLPQSNTAHTDWAEFYWSERISPQLQFSKERESLNKDIIPTKETALKVFRQIFGEIKPSLLHGDLWGGNYLIATDGTPFLIDPAIYYGHSMVDIAMSQLFGGFDSEFYESYHEIIPKQTYNQEQIKLYQLYYLLVHLNLFGMSYRSSVVDILQRYF
ncbi:MAG: fructosamine kinase family protein [Porphyromonadaceae bacterium]|nr:fructosamine kinase family protein [Porphyromonadaceae bacterium]